jgi:hypothetical protein
VLNLTSSFSLLYATSLKKQTVHLKPDSVNPLFMRVYRISAPSPEEGEIVPKSIIPHTTAAINRTDLVSQAAADADLGSNIRTPTITRPRHLHATTERHNIAFTFFSCILISPYVVYARRLLDSSRTTCNGT